MRNRDRRSAQRLAKGSEIDIATGAVKAGRAWSRRRKLFFRESENLLDVVAVGGINSGRDAYIAHLTGAQSCPSRFGLMKEGRARSPD